MLKKTQALEGSPKYPSSPARSQSLLRKKNGVPRLKSPRKKTGKIIGERTEDRFIDNLIVYPTGTERPSQRMQHKVSQTANAEEPSNSKLQSVSADRQIVSCVVYLKCVHIEKKSLKWKLCLLRAVLSFLKREIPQIREQDVLGPSFVSISSPEERKYVIAIMLPHYIVPKFLKLKPSKESNKFISRQLEDASMSVTVKFKSGQYSNQDKICMKALLSQQPRKVDTIFREMVQNFMISNETPTLHSFLTTLKNEAAVMAPSESTGDPRDYDVLVRLKTGARFKVEKRYTMKGSVLRVSKGTKIEFFWSHLFNWSRDLSLRRNSRKSLFSRVPVSLLKLIIEYTVAVPLPEPDFRTWFTVPVPICRLTVLDKKKQKRHSNSQRNSGMSYIKTNPKNFWALKKRFNFSRAKLSNNDVEKLFRLFDGFDFKFASTA